jgi:hypothetical protein
MFVLFFMNVLATWMKALATLSNLAAPWLTVFILSR